MGSRSLSNGLSGLLVLLVIGGWGARVATTRLATPRPPGSGETVEVSAPPGMVRSRLWQDPLQARDLAAKREASLPLRIQAPAELEARRAPNVLVMPLFLTPSPTPESEDIRIGMRYAVLSALGSAGFTPEQREFLRCFQINPNSAGEGGSIAVGDDSPLVRGGPVVYEWLMRPAADVRGDALESDYDAALVLWLDDGAFRSEHQICDMDELMGFVASCLAGDSDGSVEGSHGAAHAHAGGHVHDHTKGGFDGRLSCAAMTGNSNRLVDLFVEGAEFAPRLVPGSNLPILVESSQHLTHDVRFFAWSATVSNEVLMANVASSLGSFVVARDHLGGVGAYVDVAGRALEKKGATFKFPANGSNLEVVRTISTDLALMELLVRELRLRGVERRDRIALIHEWDSVYGRSLPKTFRTAAQGEGGFHNITTYSYLRGVDGKLPGDQPAGGGSASGSAAAGAGDRVTEAPVGRSRLDYIRRLVDRLEREAEHWSASDSGGRLAAIGVLGTDPYDKAPIIQALREAFPDAIFFTTDLQAGLVHGSAYPYTRNLLIASHFDLQLASAYQGGVPPFRTSYDTALYYSVLYAIGAVDPGGDIRPPGRIYEVARSGAYDLATKSDGFFYPTSPRQTTWPDWPLGYLGLLLAIVFGAAFVVFTRASVRAPESFDQLFSRRNWLLLLGALSPVGFLLIAGLIGRFAPNDEPFEWLDGLSIWPSEFIRLCGALLCIAFFAAMASSYQANIQDLCRTYRLEGDRTPLRLAAAVRSYLARLRLLLRRSVGEAWASVRWQAANWVRHRCIVNWGTPRDPNDPAPFDDVWAAYLARGRGRHRFVRTLLVGGLGVGLVGGLALVDQPRLIQHRGSLSFTAQVLMTGLSVGLVNLLAFVVWDAIRLCSRFIWNLRQGVMFSPASRDVVRDHCGLSGREADAWLTVRIAADRTRAVSQVIYYPFIVVFVLLLARYRGFEHWGVSFMLVLGYGLSTVVTVLAAIQMRRAAEDLRQGEINRLQDRLGRLESGVETPRIPGTPEIETTTEAVDAIVSGRRSQDATPVDGAGATSTKTKARAKARDKDRTSKERKAAHAAREKAIAAAKALRKGEIERTIEAIRGVRDGAFAPLTQHPVVRAVLIPFGGLGAVEIVNFLVSSGL